MLIRNGTQCAQGAPDIGGGLSDGAAERILGFARVSPHFCEMGIEVVALGTHESRTRMVPRPFMLATADSDLLHPGAIFSLADSACGTAVMAALGDLRAIATLDLRVDHLRPATVASALEARMRCTQRSEHIVFVEGEILREEDGVAVAKVLGTFIATPKEAA